MHHMRRDHALSFSMTKRLPADPRSKAGCRTGQNVTARCGQWKSTGDTARRRPGAFLPPSNPEKDSEAPRPGNRL